MSDQDIKFEEPRYVDNDVLSLDMGIALQRREAAPFAEPPHFHPSIEVNFLQDCDMRYSFSGHEFEVPRNRFCIFWAAYPHQKITVRDKGVMTNIYISLSEFLQWSLPPEFVNKIIGGAVLLSNRQLDGDIALANRLANETDRTDTLWQRLHAREVQARLHRIALEGWEVIFQRVETQQTDMIGGHAIEHFEKMLRFVALNFSNKIAVADVATAAGVSQSHAILLFRKILGRTIMEHIRDMRILHAKMLLVETDMKILTIAMDCGFGSLSTFYDTFQNNVGVSPAAFRRVPR